MRYFIYSLLFFAVVMTTGCIVVEQPHSRLAPGQWRGVLKLEQSQSSRVGGSSEQQKKSDITFEEVTVGELPFIFEVRYDTEDSFHIVIRNGEEEIVVRDIRYGLDRSTAKDTLRVDFPLMDSYLEGVTEGGVIQGHWVVNYKEGYRVPFEAKFGKADRFTTMRKTPKSDLSGAWAVHFEPGEPGSYPAIAEFKQDGNHLTGTFRTETGDYRYLEGTVQADKFYLSCFDGSHAYLFEGKILEDNTLQGIFRSGSHYVAYWEGERDPNFRLAHPDSLTKTLAPGDPITFRFKNTEGEWVSNSDPAYQGKPMIVQIMGTWCPNCQDETRFLMQYVAANPEMEISLIGIGFERYREEEKAIQALKRYKQRLEIPYPLLLGGFFNKKEAATHLPFLQDVKAYPTMLFLDKQHRIVRIHTGFEGPATSGYEVFQDDFNNFVHRLTSE